MSHARSMAAGVLLTAFVIELLEPPDDATIGLLGLVLIVVALLTVPEVAEWWKNRHGPRE